MSNESEFFNEIRHNMVKAAVALIGEPLTVEHIGQFLPADFQLGLDDLEPFLQARQPAPVEDDVVFEGEPPPVAEVKTLAESGLTDQQSSPATEIEPPPPTAEEIEAAVVRRNAADQALANRRVELLAAQSAERAAIGRVAAAVQTFQAGTPFKPMTRDELIRSHLAGEAALRQTRKDNQAPAPRIGRSAIDRVAYYSKFGGGPGAGGSRSYARGALPSQAKGAPNYNPKFGPTVKLPSEV